MAEYIERTEELVLAMNAGADGGKEKESGTVKKMPKAITDGKPCCFCETTDPLLNCYQRKDDRNDEP